MWIESVRASRRQACVLITDGGAMLEDLGSKNGTRLNGRRVKEREPLRDGDQISIGETTWTLRVVARGESTQTSTRDSAV